MINLIITDDHPIFIDGLKTVLSNVTGIAIVGEALNGKQLLELLEDSLADIVLLDINMPEMDGLETAQIVKQQYSYVKIIMLTQFGEKRFIKKCMEMGVEGYLLKDCEKQELIKAIIAVYMGGIFYNANCQPESGFFAPVVDDHNPFHISEKEKQVLKLIAEEKCNTEIAKKMSISINTVKTYRERLMLKSGTKNTAGLMYWAVKNKLL
ncbi:MAG: response regulator transcription factor [Bacteroidales bacterium]